MKKRKVSQNDFPGSVDRSNNFNFALSSTSEQFRSSNGSAEKVKTDIHNILANSEKLPDDYALFAKNLESFGHSVRISTHGLFVNGRFRITISPGPFVHLVDLRCCN